MLTYRIDPAYACAVWLFSGSSNTDDDFQRYVDSIPRAIELAQHHERAAGIVYVERDNPMPDAKWRTRIADASTTFPIRPCIAFASPSTLIRGIVMAVNWIRPPPYDFTVEHSFDDAVAWIEEQRGAPMKILFSMMAECQAEARQAAT
jgi:hypothetical protein